VLRVKSPAFLAIILLLIITNVITAEVVSHHKSDSSASSKVSASTLSAVDKNSFLLVKSVK
jgi:hypothetical protein